MSGQVMQIIFLAIAISAGIAAGYWRGRVATTRQRVRLSVPPPPGAIEQLRLFAANPSLSTEDFMVLDRVGRWTIGMIDDFADEHHAGPGLWAWEGIAKASSERWCFEGAWRKPTAEEWARLAVGKFPLRGQAFPTCGTLEEFEVRT